MRIFNIKENGKFEDLIQTDLEKEPAEIRSQILNLEQEFRIYDALVMPGVRIGNGAIVSSRSFVVQDVPAYTIVGGNPAKPIRQRFDASTVARLEALAWWDWPIEKITALLEFIVSGNVDALCKAASTFDQQANTAASR